MTRHDSTRVLWIAAAVSVAAGLALSLRTSVHMKDYTARTAAYTRWAKQLRDREDRAGLGAAALAAYERLTVKQAVPIEGVLSNSVPDQRYQLRQIGAESVEGGWTARRVEISFADADLAEVGEFLTMAESNMPPWRLVECSIDGLGEAGGRGSAVLLLEVIEKGQAGGLLQLFMKQSQITEAIKDRQPVAVRSGETNSAVGARAWRRHSRDDRPRGADRAE